MGRENWFSEASGFDPAKAAAEEAAREAARIAREKASRPIGTFEAWRIESEQAEVAKRFNRERKAFERAEKARLQNIAEQELGIPPESLLRYVAQSSLWEGVQSTVKTSIFADHTKPELTVLVSELAFPYIGSTITSVDEWDEGTFRSYDTVSSLKSTTSVGIELWYEQKGRNTYHTFQTTYGIHERGDTVRENVLLIRNTQENPRVGIAQTPLACVKKGLMRIAAIQAANGGENRPAVIARNQKEKAYRELR